MKTQLTGTLYKTKSRSRQLSHRSLTSDRPQVKCLWNPINSDPTYTLCETTTTSVTLNHKSRFIDLQGIETCSKRRFSSIPFIKPVNPSFTWNGSKTTRLYSSEEMGKFCFTSCICRALLPVVRFLSSVQSKRRKKCKEWKRTKHRITTTSIQVSKSLHSQSSLSTRATQCVWEGCLTVSWCWSTCKVREILRPIISTNTQSPVSRLTQRIIS